MIDVLKQGWKNALKENTPERWILVHIVFLIMVIPLVIAGGIIGSIVNGLSYVSNYLWSLGESIADRLCGCLHGEKTFWEELSWKEKGRWLLMTPAMLLGVAVVEPVIALGDWLTTKNFVDKIWRWIKK